MHFYTFLKAVYTSLEWGRSISTTHEKRTSSEHDGNFIPMFNCVFYKAPLYTSRQSMAIWVLPKFSKKNLMEVKFPGLFLYFISKSSKNNRIRMSCLMEFFFFSMCVYESESVWLILIRTNSLKVLVFSFFNSAAYCSSATFSQMSPFLFLYALETNKEWRFVLWCWWHSKKIRGHT